MSGLPKRARGRQTAMAEALYEADLCQFCNRILEIRSRLDFEVGSRGWCYLLETDGIVTKGEFDEAERLITRCRKRGDLPLDICSEDSKRAADGIERLDDPDVEAEAQETVAYLKTVHQYYTPYSFWQDLDCYVEIAVEKSDLKSLFARIAAEFHVVIQNVGGWADLNVRTGMMRRFAGWEAEGKQPVLLYCGDHDPGGLHISSFLRQNLEDLAAAVGWSPARLVIDRFGLDYEFIEANGLTWIDNLETGSGKSLADPRHCDHAKPYVQDYPTRFGARKVEVNALVARPEAGRELCRQAISRYVPRRAEADYQARLKAVREQLRRAIARNIVAGRAS